MGMTDMGKTIENLSLLRERLKLQKDILGYGSHIDDLSSAIALLKQFEAMPEIVRCIDCKNNSGRCQGAYYQFVTCYKTGSPHKENWFCADGERKCGENE